MYSCRGGGGGNTDIASVDKAHATLTGGRGLNFLFNMAVYVILLFLLSVLIFALKYAYGVLTKPGLKVPSIPHKSKPILTLPASMLVEKLQNGELRSEQIVQTYIERIKEVNGLINAVVQQRFEAALEEAREVDKRLENLSPKERKVLFNAKVILILNRAVC